MSDSTSSRSTPTGQGSVQAWDSIWQEYSAHDPSMRKLFTRGTPTTIYQFWQRCYFEDMQQTIQPKPEWRFLELASGRGTTSMYLASQGMKQITLLDLSSAALQQAQANFQAEGLPVPTLVSADAEQTGLADDSFECLYNIGVLEHFTDCRKIMAESLRLLRPGGKIFMPIVPAMPYSRSLLCRALFNPLSLVKRLVKQWIGKKPSHKNTGMTRTETDRHEYRRVAEAVGFVQVRCLPYNPYWKVNRDGSFVERFWTLPCYKLHRACKRLLGVGPSLKTIPACASCYLLLAEKPMSPSGPGRRDEGVGTS